MKRAREEKSGKDSAHCKRACEVKAQPANVIRAVLHVLEQSAYYGVPVPEGRSRKRKD